MLHGGLAQLDLLAGWGVECAILRVLLSPESGD